MTEVIRLWTCAAHHSAFRCGGWATVRAIGGAATGLAGGDRKTTAERMALSGLAAGLADLPASAGPIEIETASPELSAFTAILADLAAPTGDGPVEDLDLWARILSAAKGRRLRTSHRPPAPDTTGAFAAAWADFAMDKAKARGPFTTAIPRANLAKIAGSG